MEVIQWANGMLKDKDAQALLEEKVQLLLERFFKEKSEYAMEKFVKSFGEGMTYLENSLLKSEGLHPSQIQENLVYLSSHAEETAKKMNQIKNTLLNEINRQYRHFNIFLSEVSV